MKKRFAAAIAACAAISSAIGCAFAQDQSNANRIYGVDLSPDGRAYAILKQYGDQPVVAIYDADDANKQPVAVGLGDIETGAFAWGAKDHVLVQAYGTQGGIDTTEGLKTLDVSRWLSVSAEDGEVVTLFGENALGDDYFYITTSAGKLLSTLPEQSDHALFARHTLKRRLTRPSRLTDRDDTFILSLLSVNLINSHASRTEDGRENTIDWVVNSNGDAVARIDQGVSDHKRVVFTRPDGSSSFKRAADIDLNEGPIKSVSFYGLTSDQNGIQTLVKGENGDAKLIRFDMATGEFGDPLFDPSLGAINALHYEPRRAKITAVYYNNGGGLRVYHLDEADRSNQQSLEKALQGAPAAIISKSINGERMLIKAFPADRTAEYYFYDKPGRRLELIAHE